MNEVINIEDFNTRFPNLNDDIFDGFSDDTVATYLVLYSTYSSIFRKYITNKINLKEYDDKLSNSELNFPKNSDDKMDIYQDMSKKDLSYIYIRNNLYIERLTKEEKETLYDIYLKQDFSLTKDLVDFIESTYQKVIFEDVSKKGEIRRINFGPDSEEYYAYNNSLVLGINYDEFSLNGLSDEEWDQLHERQIHQLIDIVNEIVENESEKLNVPIRVVLYNEHSIKKKNIDNNEPKERIQGTLK